MDGLDIHNKYVKDCQVYDRGLKYTFKLVGYFINTAISNMLIMYNTITRGNLNVAEIASLPTLRSNKPDPECPKEYKITKVEFMRQVYFQLIPCVRNDLLEIHKKLEQQNKQIKRLNDAQKEQLNEIDYWVPWLTKIKLTKAKELPIALDQEKKALLKKEQRLAQQRKHRELQRIQQLKQLQQQRIQQRQTMRRDNLPPSRTELSSHKHLYF